jgi:hypothetical protein
LRSLSGNTLSEYCILIGLLAIVAVSSLEYMGLSISELLNFKEGDLNQTALEGYYASVIGTKAIGNSSQGNITSEASSYYYLQQGFVLPSANITGGVNATSVDGNQSNSLGTLRLAEYLDKLAAAEEDPIKQDYYAKMAKIAYYMGANEGEIDDFSSYALSEKYSNGDALNDLLALQTSMRELMDSPPMGITQKELANVMPVVCEVYNIAQNYRNQLSSMIGPDGKVSRDFMTKDPATGFAVNGAGSAFADNFISPDSPDRLTHTSYEKVVPYEELKPKVQITLNEYKLPVSPVVVTFQDAKRVEDKSDIN